MNESAMIRNPWKRSVHAAVIRPPTKLYNMNITVIATTISFVPTPPPVAWLITLPAPFSMLPMLMMKKQTANTM